VKVPRRTPNPTLWRWIAVPTAVSRRELEEIKRLNWLAVDADRGVRDRDELLREMDAIEDRLNGMIEGIREVAGQG